MMRPFVALICEEKESPWVDLFLFAACTFGQAPCEEILKYASHRQ
jgi:hypothetical protein